MEFNIDIAKPWRYRDRKRGIREIVPGTYRVPDDLPSEVAELAVQQGMGKKWVPQSPVAIATAVRKRGRPRKYPAPENKMLPNASENKSAMG